MTPDLEELIRHRAHEFWEQEGRPHGRHEEHWQRAAQEITQELERIKAAHTPATAEEIEAPAESRQDVPRKRGRKAAGDVQPEAAPPATTARRRVSGGTEGAPSDPAAEAAPKGRRKKSEAAETGPEANAADRPARRGRKPKAQSDSAQ